jgi:CheY-like chemotaxis protein
MPAKRALIVDDSRSARVILSRMLETYGLSVDAAESGEQALEYLRSRQPDVIFMDHLMPGMDGFEAVRAIRTNPANLKIPILMYTSQEGDLYANQARALGAVGVVPKTVKQVDVLRVLYQLQLLAERREAHAVNSDMARAANEHAAPRAVPPPRSDEPPPRIAVNALTTALQEQSAELRRFVLASLEAFGRRIMSEMRSAAPPQAQPASPEPAVEVPPPPPATKGPLLAGVIVAALIPTIVLGALYWHVSSSIDALNTTNARLASVVTEQKGQLDSLSRDVAQLRFTPPVESTPDATQSAAAVPIVPASTARQTELVPYGEPPLSGARLDRLRDLLDRLKAQNFKGTVRVTTFIGDFCLTGNGIEGFSVAADELLVKKCDLTGNPFEDGLTGAQRQSLPFANLITGVRKDTGGTIAVALSGQGRKPQVQYPDPTQNEKLTAGDWNRIASRNNRVEFSVEPTR